MSPPRPTAFSVALIYLASAVLWLWLSHLFVGSGPAQSFLEIPSGLLRDLLFAGGSATLLVLLLHRRQPPPALPSKNEILEQHFLAGLFQVAPAGLGLVHDRVFTVVNDRLCTLTGYSREELIGQSTRILYSDDTTFALVGKPVNRQLDAYGNEIIFTRWRHKQGELIEVLLHLTPLDPGHREAGCIFAAIDRAEAIAQETMLRQSAARYRTLVDLAVDGILVSDSAGKIVESSDSLCTMFGIARQDILGRHLGELPFTPASMAQRPQSFELLRQGQTVVCERELTRPDGTAINVEMRTKSMPDGTYQAVFRDITEQKRTEQALRESREKFALAFAASPDAVNINRLEDGMYVEINPGFTKLTGFTEYDVRDKTSLELNLWCNPADRQRLAEQLQAYGCCDNLEAKFQRKDGSIGTGVMAARVLMIGRVPHVLSITRDITQRKQAEASKERLRVAIEQAGESIIITDVQGLIQYANPAFTKITGYSLDEVAQRHLRSLDDDEWTTAYSDMWETINRGRTWSGRSANRKKDGTRYTEEVTASPVFDNQGRIVNFVLLKRDITAQLKLESQYQQAQKMESVGRLTGGVAHDFNNILAVIIGYTEMALAKVKPVEPLRDDLEKIYEAAMRSAEIIRQLLAFSRKQAITPKILDLNQTVEGMLKMLRRLIGENIRLSWEPAPSLPRIKVDPAQIDQMLANLCVNARDAVANAGVVVIRSGRAYLDEAFCAECPDLQPGDFVTLSVSDNGCGIEPGLLDTIFEPFFTTKGEQGTGLGLATVYGIVKQNHGHVEVQSQRGRGTIFTIYLPVPGYEVAVPCPELVGPLQPGQGELILLVEDDPGFLQLGQSMLEKLGYRVLVGTTPDEALHLGREHAETLDLLLTDVIMPGMNGKELASRLLTHCPGLSVLFMSGYTADMIANYGVLDEGVHFLQKPFNIHKLSEKIRAVIQPEPDPVPAAN